MVWSVNSSTKLAVTRYLLARSRCEWGEVVVCEDAIWAIHM